MAAYLMMQAHRARREEKSSRKASFGLVRMYEELSFNSHPSLETEYYDGWLLRYSNGYTGRANSVNMIYPSTIDIHTKIEECERRYASRNLPCVFKITDLSDDCLDGILEQRGYNVVTPTYLMAMELTGREFDRCECIFTDHADERWLKAHFELEGCTDQNVQATAKQMMEMIHSPARYCLIEDNGKPVACASAVIERGYMVLLNVIVSEKHRGRGWGRRLCCSMLAEAIESGARTAYLQVIQNNLPAVNLYKSLGYEKMYSYWYRKK